jgi:hypothetical protein
MKKILYFLLITISTQLSAQVGIGTDTPDNTAMLEVQSTSKGVLFPRMTTVQRTGIATPATGLHVFDTNSNSLWFYNGSFWVNYAAQAKYGDIKSGIQTTDHEGWIKLDGRAMNTLSTSQIAVAASFGISGTLPNASNSYMVQNGTTMASVSGANTATLTQANLPVATFTGTAASAGDHAHGGSTDFQGNHNHSINDPGHTHSQWTRNDDFNNSGGNPPGFTGDSAGSYTWWNINAATTGISVNSNGNHNHSITTNSAGAHTHSVSVSSGGAATPINIAPRSFSVNMFIYLGL